MMDTATTGVIDVAAAIVAFKRQMAPRRAILKQAYEDVRGHVEHALRHLLRRIVGRDRVVVDHAVEGPVLPLHLDPVADGPDVITQVELTCRLDPGKDRFHGAFCVLVTRDQRQ